MRNRPTNALIEVRNNNVDRALRTLKKKLQQEGVFREMKDKQAFVSKGEKRRIDEKKAVSRAFKVAAKKYAKENGIPLAEAKAELRMLKR